MSEAKTKILIIIPAFNEEETIGGVIADLREHVPEADILVVNDGSSDSTERVAEHSAPGSGAVITVLSHPFNMGIGATMQTGYKYARRKGYEVAVQVDADGQHPPDQIKHLLVPVMDGRADLVVGSRFLGKGGYTPSLARGAGIAFFSRLISLILRERITDPTSGFRAASRRCIEYFSSHYPDDYPEAEALVLLHKKRFSIMEVPVKMEERGGGRSSITPGRSVYYMVKVFLAILVDMLKRPG
jgi:hypothetical protein